MGVSLAIIVILWPFIGYIGSSYSAEKLIEQQLTLRDQYGLSPRPVIIDPNELETTPSLRITRDCIVYSFCG
jgi:hypothetical protein